MRRLRMRVTLAGAIAGAIAALVAGRAGAQVGHLPENSPFVDLEYRQSFTLLGGYFFAKADPAHVGPGSGPLTGVQYDIFLGGPASFTARVASAEVSRSVIDPARPVATRFLGTEKRPLTEIDAGFSFALTGGKSYRGLVPLINTGVGLVSNFRGADPGGLNLGTRFAFSYGAGLRYVPSGSRWSVRADAGNRAYQLRYPNRYFEPAIDSTQVLPSTARKSAWLNNHAVTLGLSYQFGR